MCEYVYLDIAGAVSLLSSLFSVEYDALLRHTKKRNIV